MYETKLNHTNTSLNIQIELIAKHVSKYEINTRQNLKKKSHFFKYDSSSLFVFFSLIFYYLTFSVHLLLSVSDKSFNQ